MKPKFLILTLACAFLVMPTKASALSWNWFPKMLKIESSYTGLETTANTSRTCKIKNGWGKCVVWDATTDNNIHTRKNSYKKISSFCQFKDICS